MRNWVRVIGLLFLVGCDSGEWAGLCEVTDSYGDRLFIPEEYIDDFHHLTEQDTETAPRAAYLSSTLWNQSKISVCWDLRPGEYNEERKWVRDAVEGSWNAALRSEGVAPQDQIEFVGWSLCSVATDADIEIRISDSGPEVTTLGRNLAKPGEYMYLNFTFENWSESCRDTEFRREKCIRKVAIHEFGHALGQTHEQNRPDTPSTCTDAPQGSNPDTLLSRWDPDSIMNYCRADWYDPSITIRDAVGIRIAYYPWLYTAHCPTDDETD